MQKVSHTIQTNRKTTVPLYWPLRVLFSYFKTPAAQRLPCRRIGRWGVQWSAIIAAF